MNMTPNPEPQALKDALQQVWANHEPEVRRFDLRHFPGGAIGAPPHTSYFVLVSCGAPAPNARELVRLLQKLEDEVETRSNLSVALELVHSPTGPEQSNGVGA